MSTALLFINPFTLGKTEKNFQLLTHCLRMFSGHSMQRPCALSQGSNFQLFLKELPPSPALYAHEPQDMVSFLNFSKLESWQGQ